MIVLDTNVVSEVVKPAPSPNVIDWLNGQESSDLYITAITLGEISYGVEVLPAGTRRTSLARALNHFIDQAFGDRILVFDRESATEYGRVMAGPSEARTAAERTRRADRGDHETPAVPARDEEREGLRGVRSRTHQPIRAMTVV